MKIIRLEIIGPRAMQILQEMHDRGWIELGSAEGDGIVEEKTINQRMTDEEFENYAAELLAQ